MSYMFKSAVCVGTTLHPMSPVTYFKVDFKPSSSDTIGLLYLI